MTTIVNSTFTAPDGTNLNGFICDTGQQWSALVNTWSIIGNRAYQSGGTGAGIVVVESGKSDVDISSDKECYEYGGIAFRLTDSKNYFLYRVNGYAGQNQVQLYRFQNGSATLVGSKSISFSQGTIYALKVVANGSSIECFLDGVSQIKVNDTFNQTATKHGFREQNSTLTEYYDNFTVSDLSTQPTGTPVTYTYDTKQSIYKNINLNADTKQGIYTNRLTQYDTKQIQYKTIQELFDTEQIINEGFTQVTYNYDVKIEQYKPIQESIDTKQAIYKDIELNLDTKQIAYKAIQTLYDTLIQLRNEHDETLYATLTIQRVIEHHLRINKGHEDTLKIQRTLEHILRI